MSFNLWKMKTYKDKAIAITAKELARTARESYPTIDHWSSEGLLHYFLINHGRGPRLYRRDLNLARIKRIRELQERGHTLTSIRKSLAKNWTDEKSPLERPQIVAVTRELVAFLAKHPNYLHELHTRKFEELVAEVVRDMGYDVEMTPITHDGGRDVLAYLSTPLGRELTIIECKKYRGDNRIGIEIVRQFLWVLEQEDKANRGLIATTSYFTKGAILLEKDHRWRLGLRDFNHITGWLANYGRWDYKRKSGLWIPHT